MARTYARISCKRSQDPRFIGLSVDAQWALDAAVSQPTMTLVGVTTWTPKRLSRLSSTATPESVEKAVAELEAAGFVVTDDETEELWVCSFIRDDGVLGVPNVIISMSHEWAAVQSTGLRAAVLEWFKAEYPDGFVKYLCETFDKAFPRQLKGLHKDFLEGLAEPLPEPLAEGLAEGSHPVSVSVTTSLPVSSSALEPELWTTDDLYDDSGEETGSAKRLGDISGALDITYRIAAACTGNNRARVRKEAAAVAAWAKDINPQVIEEAIGWFNQPGKQRPDLPRAIALLVRKKAADAGHWMPEFVA